MARRDDAKVISVRLTEEERNWMAQYAEQEDLSISQIIRKSLKYFKKEVIDKK